MYLIFLITLFSREQTAVGKNFLWKPKQRVSQFRKLDEPLRHSPFFSPARSSVHKNPESLVVTQNIFILPTPLRAHDLYTFFQQRAAEGYKYRCDNNSPPVAFRSPTSNATWFEKLARGPRSYYTHVATRSSAILL